MFKAPLPYKVIQITGPDTLSFLQGQITCDTDLDGKARFGAHCNLKGRMVALFLLVPCQEGVWLVAEPAMANIAIEGLKKYSVFSKVKFEELTSMSVEAYWSQAPSNISPWTTHHEHEVCTVWLPAFHELKLVFSIRNTSLTPVGSEIIERSYDTFRARLIQAGLPCLSHSISELLLPHDINLPSLDGVSFKKGCYLGQEIISRMHFKATIKRHLAVYMAIPTHSTATELSINTPITYEDKEIGSVIDCAKDDDVIYISALISDEFKDKAMIEGYTLTLQPLPYAIRD